MARDPKKGQAALRRGRFSVVGATYFVTICTEGRTGSLLESGRLGTIFSELGRMESDGAIAELRCTSVLPDHLHMLFQLGERLALGQVVSRLKSKTTFLLRQEKGLKWQRSYHDHRIDADEPMFPVLAYMYRNPVRAGLVKATRTDSYPGWWICRQDAEWFYGEATLARWEEVKAPEWLSGSS